LAQQLRQNHPDRRIELDLGGRSPEDLATDGEQMGIGEIIWINADGKIP
jgi:ATP phosphoribosyltransferase regulatory subunit